MFIKNINRLALLFLALGFSQCQVRKVPENAIRLHDLWGVKKLLGKTARTPAVLELYPSQRCFSLTIAKHDYSGKIRLSKKNIAFNFHQLQIPADARAEEKQLIQLLQQVGHWQLKSRRLFLYQKNREVLQLMKID